MAQSKDIQRRGFPLPAYNFRVSIGDTTMSFAEVSGITVEYEAVTYRDGYSFQEGESIQTFPRTRYEPVVLRRGIVPGAAPTFLYQWMKSQEVRSMSVSLCDQTGTPVISWNIAKALPVKLTAPTFDAATHQVAVESLELRARGVSLAEHD